jgi:hypothetical protein
MVRPSHITNTIQNFQSSKKKSNKARTPYEPHTPFEIFRHHTHTPPNHTSASLTNPLNFFPDALAGRVTRAVRMENQAHRTLSRPAGNHKALWRVACPASISFPVGGYSALPPGAPGRHTGHSARASHVCVSAQTEIYWPSSNGSLLTVNGMAQ